MQLADTHAHLDMPQLSADLPQVIERAERAGLRHIICVGTDLPSSRRCVELARRFPRLLRAAVGIHPSNTPLPEGQRDAVAALAALPETVAVGETGLDFYRDGPPEPAQRDSFERHVQTALELGKPIIVHSRRADEEVLSLLEGAGPGLRGVRHCFDAGPEVAARYVELGFHIAFGGAVTRPGYRKLKAAAGIVPADRLLLETDCPYQVPASRAGRRNEPAFIVETLRALAALRGEEPEDLAEITTANARHLFALP